MTHPSGSLAAGADRERTATAVRSRALSRTPRNHRPAVNVAIGLLLLAWLLAAWAPAQEPAPAASPGYGWYSVTPAELKQHFRKLIRVVDAHGHATTGMLIDLVAGTARLRRAAQDGGDLVQLRLDGLQSVEVFDRR